MAQLSRKILQSLFAQDTSARGLTVTDAFVRADLNPSPENIRELALARQVEGFTKKRVPSGAEARKLEESARETFRSLNKRCEEWRFPKDPSMAARLHHARAWVATVLPPLSLVEEAIWPLCSFGPGVTFAEPGISGRHLLTKVGGLQSSTLSAFRIFSEVCPKYFPAWLDVLQHGRVQLLRGNRSAFVPKDERKCRRIAVEGSLNLFLQMGVGKWLARRLEVFGLDLRDQSRNRSLAREGSLSGRLATLDLSNASDTISRNLVKALLPPDWFELLDALRSPSYLEDGKWTDLHSFSSQGNAFTFPLETLIFWALGKTVCDQIHAYGDDLICDTPSACDLIELLEVCGFSVNSSKSFFTGNFRESCGADFIAGVDVRPIYYKDDCVRPSDIAKLHNLLKWRWGSLPSVEEYLLSAAGKRPLRGPREFWADRISLTSLYGGRHDVVDAVTSRRLRFAERRDYLSYLTSGDVKSGYNQKISPFDLYFWDEGCESGTYRVYRSKTRPIESDVLALVHGEVCLRANLYAGRVAGSTSASFDYLVSKVSLTV